ncbi:hypothetical protein Tco_0138361 [Tanacetum coccineum]
MDEDELILIILGRPFLTTARAVIDVHEEKLSLRWVDTVDHDGEWIEAEEGSDSDEIPIALEDQEKTTFTYLYGTFAYKRMPFRLCNALETFQRCMTAIFHELIEDSMEVFMDDFSIFGSSFNHCLQNLEKMLKRCEETNLVLNWENATSWLLQEGAKNLAVDHLSRLENPDLGKLTKAEIRDLFPEEQLMTISNKSNEPWYADYANYLASCVLPFRSTRQEKQKFFNDLRLDAYESSIFYKDRTKMWHDKQIKAPTKYEKGDKALLFNSRPRLFPGNLKSRWYGPFAVSKDMKNEAIELYDEDGNEFIVNKQRVKPYQKDAFNVDKDDDITLEDEGEVT